MSEISGGTFNRRKLLKTAAAGAAVVGGATLLEACGSGSSSTSAGTATTGASAGAIQRGGTLTVGQIGFGSAETLNVSLLNTAVDFLREVQMIEGLWEWRGEKFELENVLAESNELNKDATVLTVNLRKGITWHDGKPFTADDVVWNVKNWEKVAGLANVVELIDFKGVRKLDKYVVEIPMTKPVADLPGIAATSWSSYMIPNGVAYDSPKSIGTGPFILESFEPGRAVFKANKDYWRGAPYLDGLISDSSFRSEEARYNALLAGNIDVAPALDFTLAKSAQSAPGIQVLDAPTPGYVSPNARVDIAPFNDPRVMTALKLLTNREAIQESVFNGFASLGNDLGMNGAPYFASDLKHPYDPEQAESLLKEAGADGFSATMITSDFFPGATQLATIYSQQAKEVGLNIEVKKIDASQYFSFEGKDGYLNREMGIMSWNPTSLAGYYLLGLYTKAPYNETHWGNPKADKLMFEAIGEQDPGKAEDLWHEVQKLQFDEGGYIIPTNLSYVDAQSDKVQGAKVTPSGNDYNNFDFMKVWKSS
ncbi:MAG: ABC transporter substrate-binding protein [Solirubrobacterales bacterium]